ncbi:MAG: thioesterase family protein [Actinobacteria bacterium]|nr:thioesterase family protein [Actinomycetota bacterium]
MTEAFYVPEGDRYVPTAWTRGPWGPDAQHAGPPAALLGRAVEALEPGDLEVARFTLEVLRPVPLAPLRVEAGVVRPGRRVQLAEASLFDREGEVARATAWRIRPGDGGGEIPERGLGRPPFAGPDETPRLPVFDPGYGESYFTAIEWRGARGRFLEPGPASAWMRLAVPLVAGEEPSPLSRVLVVADSGNGISAELPMARFWFINVELTVHLVRMPEGEWVCVDAVSRIDPRGIGVAQSTLWDERGRIGSGNQSLLVAPR